MSRRSAAKENLDLAIGRYEIGVGSIIEERMPRLFTRTPRRHILDRFMITRSPKPN